MTSALCGKETKLISHTADLEAINRALIHPHSDSAFSCADLTPFYRDKVFKLFRSTKVIIVISPDGLSSLFLKYVAPLPSDAFAFFPSAS